MRNPHEARALGISMVFQHFSLFDTLTAAENVWLGLDKSLSLAEVTERIRKVAGDYGLEVDPLRPVHTLSVGERQRVEIVRALMTEPEAADPRRADLGADAAGGARSCSSRCASSRAEGCSILYISHKLDEIRALCHHCTVLRGGKVTGEVDPTQETNASLSRLMIGAEPPQLQHREAQAGAVVLEVQGPDAAEAGPVRHRPERHRARGARRRDRRRRRRLGQRPAGADGRAVGRGPARAGRRRSRCSAPTSRAPRRAARRRLGLHFVPEERLGRGAVPTLSLAQNTLLTRTDAVGRGGWIRIGDGRAARRAI